MNYIMLLIAAAILYIFVLGHLDLKDLIRITLYLVILQKLIILLPWQQKAQSQSGPLRGGEVGVFPRGPD